MPPLIMLDQPRPPRLVHVVLVAVLVFFQNQWNIISFMLPLFSVEASVFSFALDGPESQCALAAFICS